MKSFSSVSNSLDAIHLKKKSVKISTILPFRDASAVSVDYDRKRMSARKSLAFQDRGVLEAIKTRDKVKIVQNGIDVTPKHFGKFRFDFDISDTVPSEGISLWGVPGERRSTTSTIHADLYKSSLSFTRRTSTIDMDTMCNEIEMGGGVMEDDRQYFFNDDVDEEPEQSFLKVILRETDDVVLYECNSTTVPAESEDAATVLEDNTKYEYLTVGKGKHRPTLDAETQTSLVLMKSVGANTERIKTENAATFVSNFEMYDTYTDLERITESVDLDTENTLQMTTYSRDGFNVIDDMLRRSKNFKFSSMVLQRLLASNIYREQQKRFRNMIMPDPLDLSIKYLYRLEPLWTYKMTETIGKGVSSLSWCHGNSDILAVGYGVYDFVPYIYRTAGYVAIWSIKNPVNPERRYRFDHPVTSVEFSKETPQLLAVGFFNGMIEVLDISDSDTDCVVARSQRNESASFEPIWDMKWVLAGTEEELLTVSEDGIVMKYKLINSPYLLGLRQIKLDMVLGDVEGLVVNNIRSLAVMDRQPQALCIEMHPIHKDIFFIGTNEGCLHRCSTFIPNQYSGILRVHKGSVSGMEFSPFSPKIFLTYGSDWYVRIWIEGITTPIIELNSGFKPIRSAHWCPNHSTIIACTTKSKLNIWNLRKSILKPASTKTFESPLTICRFSKCGRSLVYGMSDGSTHCSALEDMPFPPHFQYDVLEEVVQSAVRSRPELQLQVKILGFLGYNKDNKK
ncbi:dynein intermediate chain 4, axonemal-like [Bradysia coprophila]|uniref:dynein intermediate chain 4, axonemal-like n=1 Tax=Bradysia coprophila TaxID=38358 RepID=UPI00187D85E6|nr:dynein intermediate chain 4, axonemal-like [Bradysia coprophila]